MRRTGGLKSFMSVLSRLASIRTSFLLLRLFCRFLSGRPVMTPGPESRKEPEGLGEIVWTRRLHDVIPGSGTAVWHCVIVCSEVQHLVLLGRHKATLFTSSASGSPFHTSTQNSRCLFARLNTHKLIFSHTAFSIVLRELTNKQT